MADPVTIGLAAAGIGAGYLLLRDRKQPEPEKSGAEKVRDAAQVAGAEVIVNPEGDGVTADLGSSIVSGNVDSPVIVETNKDEIELFPDGFPEEQTAPPPDDGGTVSAGSFTLASDTQLQLNSDIEKAITTFGVTGLIL